VGGGNSIVLWDLETRRHLSTFDVDSGEKSEAFAMTFTSERELCVVADSDLAPIITRDVVTGRVVSRTLLKPGTGACIGRFTPGSQYLVTAGPDIAVYRVEDSCLVASAPAQTVGRALAISADGICAATVSFDASYTLRLWSLPELTELAGWSLRELGCSDLSCALAFSARGQSVVAAGWDGVVRGIRLPNVAARAN
jgi:WD40 repeat protein